MRSICFFLVLICFGWKLRAQPYFDVTNVQYQYSPDGALYGKDKNPLATGWLMAGLNIPLKVYKKDVFLVNPSFEWNKLDFIQNTSEDVDLYGVMLALSYVKQWKNEKWKTVFVSVNRISSDLRNVTIHHYQPGGAILAIYEKNKKIRYKVGMYYNSEFFGAFVLPLFGLDWKISDRFFLHGIIPRNMVLEYRITPHIYAGINLKTITNSYRFLDPDKNAYYLLVENQAKLFADFYFAKRLVFNIEAGHTFIRQYRKRSESQQLSGLSSNLGVNEGLLFKAGLFYRIRLDN